jgi:hypothetical protein
LVNLRRLFSVISRACYRVATPGIAFGSFKKEAVDPCCMSALSQNARLCATVNLVDNH